jgi:hypothetical protein
MKIHIFIKATNIPDSLAQQINLRFTVVRRVQWKVSSYGNFSIQVALGEVSVQVLQIFLVNITPYFIVFIHPFNRHWRFMILMSVNKADDEVRIETLW